MISAFPESGEISAQLTDSGPPAEFKDRYLPAEWRTDEDFGLASASDSKGKLISKTHSEKESLSVR